IIVITAWSQLETAIELVKAGAADYLPKPWNDVKLLETIASYIKVEAESVKPKSRSHSDFIYQSKAMAQLIAMATKVADSDISVLISGANGCGKEKLADYIHQQSSRTNQPLIKVNMGAIPHDLIEAELFGAQKGAYTGANSARIGRFEAAAGGTLFLDEIGNLSLQGQMKLLRVLQTGEFERLGSSETIQVDVRVISATNTDLPAAIKLGLFRQDLYYRLNVIELNLLPLAQRPADIIPLAHHFIGSAYQLSTAAEQFLLAQPWPGNVRELENCCKRALVFASNDELSIDDFGGSSSTLINVQPSEKEQMQQVLDKHNWTISRAANELGLSRQALYRRIEKFELVKGER
ncbi:MAG: sigma-54-dependent Fis family transcriptional regulator, partial [Gammaproteobacteria bacterium]|nr:sigma-54-dependent Fis family transcriptional regulator [Gammaproteobacteria bacterium]